MRRMIKFCVIYDEKQNIQEHWKENHGMDDAQIVDLYFARDESAITETKTSIKYVLLDCCITFYITGKIQKNV